MNKLYRAIALTTIFFLNVVTAFAMQVPCPGDPTDPGYDPNNCPLDTWVIVLAASTLIFTTVYLCRKQRAITSA
jgi:hypothetical protein